MLTRCPRCQTAFRVTPEQLKARQGRVRCGQCQSVFNALETLVEETPVAPSVTAIPDTPPLGAPEPPAAETALPEAWPLEDQAEATPPVEPTPEAEPAAQPEPVPAAERQPEPEPAPEPDAEPGLKPAPEPESDVAAAPDTAPPPAPQPEPPAKPRSRAQPAPVEEPLLLEEEPAPRAVWPWVVGSLLALLALAIQAAIAFRVELAVLLPEARPALVALCDLAGCQITLPRKIELVGIETSDLRPGPGKSNRLLLDAGLRNRAPFIQAWPHLELTITDTSDKTLIRRVLAPADYLPPEMSVEAGLAANREQTIHLEFETAGIAAAGYRLYIFYP